MPTNKTEVPSGAIDGSNKIFNTSVPYTKGSLFTIADGLWRIPSQNDGVIETNPLTGEFQTKLTLATGQSLLANFLTTDQDSDLQIFGRIPIVDQNTTNAITVVAGENATIPFLIRDAEENPIDLTGCTVYFTVKYLPTDSMALIAKDSTHPLQILIAIPVSGSGEIYLLPADEEDLAPGIFPVNYAYDVWVKFPDSSVQAVIFGATFTVRQRVTVLP